MIQSKEVDGVFASAHDPFTRKVFNAADRLKVVSRNGVGYDKVDVEAATEKGVCVTLAPIPEHIKSVADSAFTLILASLRRIPLLDRIARSDNWSGDRFIRFVHDAYGKQLGIIGLGRIGTELARRARGFDMEVVYYDVVRKEDVEKSLGVRYVSLEDLLGSSDIVSINVALTPQTHHMMGDKEFAMMKDGAFRLNPFAKELQSMQWLCTGRSAAESWEELAWMRTGTRTTLTRQPATRT